MTLKELAEKKAAAVKKYREIVDAADTEKRPLSAEDKSTLDTLHADIDAANAEIARLQDDEKRRQFLVASEDSLRQPILPGSLQRSGADDASLISDRRSLPEKVAEYQSQGCSRKEALDLVVKTKNDRTAAQQSFVRQYLLNGLYAIDPALRERAALQMDNDTQAGYLLMPEQFVARLIQDLDRTVFIRQIATVWPMIGGTSMGAPSLDTDMDDVEWTTELGTGTADTALAFGKRKLEPHDLAKKIKVSKQLLMANTAISVEGIVRERMNYKFGTVQENAFLNGSGAGRPLGVFTASAQGISTGRDVSTGNTSTSITTDGLIEAKYSMESQWMSNTNLRWIFHRSAVKQIRKLKDGDGQYLWQPGLRDDMTDRILNIPVLVSEYAPSTFTASQYVGILGDFSYYWIADAMSVSIQRLVELYAETNQDGFFGRMKLDGMPVLETAFARVKLAA